MLGNNLLMMNEDNIIFRLARNNPAPGIMPQRMNADALGDAGTRCRQANEPMQLARTHVPPAVAGKQPGLAGGHPPLLARGAPPFTQYIEQGWARE
jgi:hypothetical protein